MCLGAVGEQGRTSNKGREVVAGQLGRAKMYVGRCSGPSWEDKEVFRQRCQARWEDKEVSWEGDIARRAGQNVLGEGYIDKEFLEEASCALNS